MKDRIIIKGFFSQSTETHTNELPTPQKPIGFEYANKDMGNEVEESDEKSALDLDISRIAFINTIKKLG